ncbi:Gfo/Idh/MocA family protein [Anaerotalea alkaliphila]|uniref:Gfo/Idh/MocA family oxidoreductase n=1 Tax=Anaerotalea alkaliphila TaxID=2662126 RepID=A0A7X5HVM5_9FIRM|nr:Gfo/Idh/MocA family oxidoreductase [Anaerotalea alkaliphila]NDL67497.1 Gfo/Idh/MocA family oxidoreductase [Anaerotalea alkaliphila]
MLRVAVIGLGDIALVHLPIIQSHPDAVLVAVCDIDRSKRALAPEAAFYTDHLEMLEQEDLDCVHNCLPHHLHFPVTKACAERGIHVFQEKPVAMNTREAMELVALEDANPGVRIGICMQNRFNESTEALLELVRSGNYGKVLGVKGLVTWHRPRSYYESKPWRGRMELAGGGTMINQSIHTLDLLQLLGGEVEAIRGSVDNLLDYGIEVEDTATAHIRFKNGARGLYFATNCYAGNSSVEIQVLLENGKFTIKDNILMKTNASEEKEKIVEDSRLPGSKFYYGASHKRLVGLFYEGIRTGSRDYVHARDALASIRMVDAIRMSSELKKEVHMEDF